MSDKNFKVKNGLDANGAVTITQPSTSTVPLTILANTLATGSNLLEVKRPDGTVRLSVGNDGSFSAQNLVAYNVRFYSAQQGSQGLIIRGLPSQTANLQEWRDINETVLASVSASGSISAADLTLSGNLTVNGTTTNLNSTNLIIEDKNIIIADVATPTDTTADGAGITIKGATDKTFSWINSTKSFTSSEPLIINNSSITTVPLVIKGYASQTANLTEWQNNSNQVVSSIRSNGGLSINYANSIRLFNTANTDYASLWMDNGSGGTNLYVKTNYPVLMGDVGVDTGASLTVATQGVSQVGQVIRGIASQTADLQQWQRSNGNPDLKVTNFGTLISGGGTTIASNPTINAYGAALVVNSGINTYPMVILKAASSQAANIQEWQNSAGTKVSTISPLGYLSINKSYTSYPLEVNGSLYAKDATAGSLYIQGGNNLIYPSILTGVGGNGWTSVTANYTASPDGTTTATRYVWSSNGACFVLSSGTTNIANTFYTASVYVKPNNSTSRLLFSMRQNDSGDFANVEFDSSTNTASYSQKTPTSTFSNGTAGSIYVGNGWYRIWVTAKPTIVLPSFAVMFSTPQNNGDVNIWGAQLEQGYYASAYTPTTNAAITSTNNLYVPSGTIYSTSIQSIVSGTATLNTNGNTGAILIDTVAAANKGLIVKGSVSQTANLQEWQNSNGSTISSVLSNGTFQDSATGFSAFGMFLFDSSLGIVARGTTATKFYYNANDTILEPLGAAYKGLIIKGADSQTANLQEWQNSAGTALAVVSNVGTVRASIFANLTGSLTYIATNFDTSGIGIVISSAAQKGLIVRGAGSQSANLQEWQDSAGTVLSSISSAGSLNLGAGKLVSFSNGTVQKINLGYGGNYSIGVDDYTTVLTADNNGFNGRVGIRPHDATYGTSYVSPVELYANGQIKQRLLYTTSVGLTIKGAASQSANLTQWQDSSGSVLSRVQADGTFVWGSASSALQNSSGRLIVNLGSAASVGVTVKGYASQTGDLQQWQDSTGTVLNTITSSGTLVIGGTSPINSSFGITLSNKSLASYYSPNNSSYNTSFNFARGNTTGNWMGIGTIGDSANGVSSIAISDSSAQNLFTVGQTGNTAITLRSDSSIGLIIKGSNSQTADLQQWQTGGGQKTAWIDSQGQFTTGYYYMNLGGNVLNSGLVNIAPTGNIVPLLIRGMASQTANLQNWQNSAGTTLASVDSSGNITDASNTAWLSPIGSGSNDAVAIQALIDAGKKEIRLGSGQWTFSTRIKVPNGVTIRGTGTSRSSTTGTRVNAVALIASEGTVRDIMFTGAGENAQSELGGGGIAVLGGRVIDCSVTDSRWVLAPTRQAHGYLKNFMSKMQGGYGSVKVAVLGDSLSENTSTTSWYGYLFNTATTATGYYLGSYFGHQIATSEVDNMAIGGQGAYLLSAQLAMTKDTVRTGDYVNQVLDGDSVSTSPFFSRDYSLAILAIGQNGGEDWKAHLEYTVKSIRDRGIDVIILTQNPAAGAPTSRAGDEYFYRSMAETYGCLLVDTQAYFRLEVEFGRALGTTADLFGDGIHQSALGHQLYAKAILNGILDYDSTIPVPSNPVVVSRSYVPAQADRATAIAGLNAYYLVKKPDPSRGLSGVTYTSATDSSIRNPIYGRGTTTNSVATLASGGYATWGVEYATAAYIIYRENATANTLTVAIQAGGSTLATLTTGVTNGRTSVQKVMLSGGYPANRAIRITNTTGDPVQIYGVVFETHADVAFNRNTDGSYPGVKLNGSWAYSNLLNMVDYGSYLTPYTSTTNDSVTFKFYGDGLRFATSNGKNSGIIQVKIDDTTYTAVDTYYNIGEYGVFTHFYGGLQYGLHTATITLTGANAAVTGLISDGARFGLHRISAVRSEWYLTQDQQLAPNSDISAKVNSLSSPTIGSTGGANIATFYNGTNGYGAGSITSTGTFNINGANMGFPYTSTGATLNVNAGASSIVPLTVKGVSGQTASLQEWYDGAGQSIASISPYSEFSILGNSYFANAADYGARVNVSSSTASKIGIIIRGVASQTADLQQWQNSAGTTKFKIDTYGQTSSLSGFYATGGGGFGAAIVAQPGAATLPAIIAKGFTSQTASLQEWQNVSATVLAKVDSLGNFTATSKSFDIIHPTKENMRLRYGSLEGPENGVYIRGTAESNIIELPDYWTGLVHSDSITVSLTSVGSAQNIYVEKIENNKVYIGGNLEKAFFTVYGERKDIDKLTVEY